MADRIIELAKGIRDALAALQPLPVERRYVPFFERDQVKDGKIAVLMAEDDPNTKRNVDTPKLLLDIAYHRALPASTDAFPDPLDDTETLDAFYEQAATVRALFDEGGPMREKVIANSVFLNCKPTTLYRQDWLFENQIFVQVCRLEYFYEGP